MNNALTVDLEDYYHVTAFRDSVAREHWNAHESRVERNTDLLLGWFAEAGFQATFFTLGWVAEQNPALVRRIAEQGHEIACHSLRHRLVYEMTPEEFREDTGRAKALLEDVSGKQVYGYRAPSFSITRDSQWAFEILAELGFTYDSSIFPVKHVDYGMPHAPRGPFRVQTRFGSIVEFPMPTLSLGSARSPVAGGAYLRLLPYAYTRWGIRYINRHESLPVCVYLHPWEIDTDQPRIRGGLTARIRQYFGLRGTEVKLRRLLNELEFCSLGSVIDNLGGASSGPTDVSLSALF